MTHLHLRTIKKAEVRIITPKWHTMVGAQYECIQKHCDPIAISTNSVHISSINLDISVRS